MWLVCFHQLIDRTKLLRTGTYEWLKFRALEKKEIYTLSHILRTESGVVTTVSWKIKFWPLAADHAVWTWLYELYINKFFPFSLVIFYSQCRCPYVYVQYENLRFLGDFQKWVEIASLNVLQKYFSQLTSMLLASAVQSFFFCNWSPQIVKKCICHLIVLWMGI
jgi:hypothetical protein